MKRFLILFFLFIAFYASAQDQFKKSIEVTDLLKIRTIGKPQISPDGLQILFTIMEIKEDTDKKGEFAYFTHLYIGDKFTKTYRPLTFGKYSISNPSWSPDGKSILFTRDLGNKSQAYLLKLNGGEPMPLTTSSKGVTNAIWSKDGTSIYYQERKSLSEFLQDSLTFVNNTFPSWNLEKPNVNTTDIFKRAKPNPNGSLTEIRAYLNQNEKDKKAKVINRINFQEETTTSGEFAWNYVYKMSIAGIEKPKLVNQPLDRWIEWEEVSSGFITIIPTDSIAHPDRVLESKITLYKNGSHKDLVSKKGYSYSNLTWNPSGNILAFIETSTNLVENGTLKMINLTDNSISNVPFDRTITQMKWSEDGSVLFFSAQDRGGVPIFSYHMEHKKIIQNTSEIAGVLGFDCKNDFMVYAKTCIQNPSELYINNTEGNNEVLFTEENVKWLNEKFISIPVKKSFKNTLGQMVDYWVMKPKNYKEGVKFPMVVEIHGGPAAMWGTGEASMWHEYQYYASKGMGVVYSNPRGSGGYGSRFLASNVKDWGAGPMSDVMKMTDLAIQEGWVDSTQVAVTGGSYAGYLVTWIVGHTNRFKVACSQRGVYELSTFFGEGNAWRLVPKYFGGYPWEKSTRVILDRESPLTYVSNIRTPLIIFHGESDLRTGVIGSEMLYKSLKVLGREVEYVRHPDASHEITRNGNNRQRIDQMLRTFEFFSRYINLQN